MTTCLRCHRPLKNPAINGMGPVCAKASPPLSEVSRDLFGYEIELAAHAALVRLEFFIAIRTARERHAIGVEFSEARKRLGVTS